MTNPTPHGQEPEALRLAQELDAVPETGADPQTIQEAAAELRRQHARIAELEARIKTMAEEHADELMVAHLDGRMRAAQHCRATLDILDGKDNGAGACNEPWASVRKRLLSIVELHQSSSAAQGGSVPAGVQQPDTAYADLMQAASDWICEHVENGTPGVMIWAIRLQSAAQKLRASHGQAPAQAAPVCGSPADLPPLPDPDLRDVGTTPGGIKEFLRGYATEYAKAALAAHKQGATHDCTHRCGD